MIKAFATSFGPDWNVVVPTTVLSLRATVTMDPAPPAVYAVSLVISLRSAVAKASVVVSLAVTVNALPAMVKV